MNTILRIAIILLIWVLAYQFGVAIYDPSVGIGEH